MTVKDLIKHLLNFDMDLEVFIQDNHGHHCSIEQNDVYKDEVFDFLDNETKQALVIVD